MRSREALPWNRRRARAACVALALLCSAGLGAEPPELAREWVVNDDLSDDPSDRLTGLAMIRDAPPGTGADKIPAGAPARYFQEQEMFAERRRENSPASVGELQRVLEADRLSVRGGATAYTFIYDTAFERPIAPRAGGPVYSAKGDEFVATAIGRTLAYWRADTLIIETMLAPRGTMIEELSVAPETGQLTIRTTIQNPDWIRAADIVRVFDPEGASH